MKVTDEMINRVMPSDDDDYPGCPLCNYTGHWNFTMSEDGEQRKAIRALLEKALMDSSTRNEMNAKIDVLFDQIAKLDGDELVKAAYAVELWQSAKVQEFVGLGPMETRTSYKRAFQTLTGLGLETGGMIQPYERA